MLFTGFFARCSRRSQSISAYATSAWMSNCFATLRFTMPKRTRVFSPTVHASPRQLGMVRRLLLPLGLVDAAALQQLLHHGLEVKKPAAASGAFQAGSCLQAAEVQRQVPALGVLASSL